MIARYTGEARMSWLTCTCPRSCLRHPAPPSPSPPRPPPSQIAQTLGLKRKAQEDSATSGRLSELSKLFLIEALEYRYMTDSVDILP